MIEPGPWVFELNLHFPCHKSGRAYSRGDAGAGQASCSARSVRPLGHFDVGGIDHGVPDYAQVYALGLG